MSSTRKRFICAMTLTLVLPTIALASQSIPKFSLTQILRRNLTDKVIVCYNIYTDAKNTGSVNWIHAYYAKTRADTLSSRDKAATSRQKTYDNRMAGYIKKRITWRTNWDKMISRLRDQTTADKHQAIEDFKVQTYAIFDLHSNQINACEANYKNKVDDIYSNYYYGGILGQLDVYAGAVNPVMASVVDYCDNNGSYNIPDLVRGLQSTEKSGRTTFINAKSRLKHDKNGLNDQLSLVRSTRKSCLKTADSQFKTDINCAVTALYRDHLYQ